MDHHATSKTVILDRDLAAEYIQLHGQIGPMEKRMEELKKILLPQLVDGAISPPDLHALLVNRPQERAQPNWKAYALSLLLKLYERRKDAGLKAAAEIEKVDAAWPRKETPALHVVLNPAFVEKPASPR
jgi:hypothetical protein